MRYSGRHIYNFSSPYSANYTASSPEVNKQDGRLRSVEFETSMDGELFAFSTLRQLLRLVQSKMCKECVINAFPDRNKTCLESGSYLLNFKGRYLIIGILLLFCLLLSS